MKQILVALALVVPLSVSVGFAGAQSSLSKKESRCQKAAKQGKTCMITFGTGEDIEGGVVAPDGIDVMATAPTLFGGLIKLRTDFRDLIVAQADDL